MGKFQEWKQARKEKKEERKRLLKEEGTVETRTGLVGKAWHAIRHPIGEKVHVRADGGGPVPKHTSEPRKREGKKTREEIEQHNKENDPHYGSGRDETGAEEQSAPAQRQPESAKGIGGDADAGKRFVELFHDAITRGHARIENGTSLSIREAVTKEIIIDREDGTKTKEKLVTYLSDFIIQTPIEEYNPGYQKEMAEVRKNLVEKLNKENLETLTFQEIDILIMAMLNQPGHVFREVFFDYLLNVATSEKENSEVGSFIAGVLTDLTKMTSTSVKLAREVEEGVQLKGLMNPAIASAYLEEKSAHIIEDAVKKFKESLPGDLDGIKRGRYVDAFKQTLLSSSEMIKNTEAFGMKMQETYRKDIGEVKKGMLELANGIIAFNKDSEVRKEKIDEKYNEVAKEIDKLGGIDAETRNKLDAKLKKMKKVYDDKCKILSGEEFKKAIKEACKVGEEGDNARKEVLPTIVSDLGKFDEDMHVLSEDISKIHMKDDPVVKKAKEIVDGLKNILIEPDGITADQYVIATVLYEGGLSSSKIQDSNVEITQPKLKWPRRQLRKIGKFQIIKPGEEKEGRGAITRFLLKAETKVSNAYKGIDNFFTKPWLSRERTSKMENKIARWAVRLSDLLLVTPAQIILNIPFTAFVRLPKFVLWDVKYKRTELGVFKRIFDHFSHSGDWIKEPNKKGELEYYTKRGWYGASLAAFAVTLGFVALSYVTPYLNMKRVDGYLQQWKQQTHINPFNEEEYEALYPKFVPNLIRYPFVSKKERASMEWNPLSKEGWGMMNEQHWFVLNEERLPLKPGQKIGKARLNKSFLVDLQKNPRYMLQAFYSRKNPTDTMKDIDQKELELGEQLEWLTERPEVVKFLVERRHLRKIGLIAIEKGMKGKTAQDIEDLKKNKEIIIEGDVMKRVGFLPGEIEDGLKLNRNKTKDFIDALRMIEEDMDGKEVDYAYLDDNLKVWEDFGILVPKKAESYMNTYGITDPRTAELIIASPDIEKWLSPLAIKGHAPKHIKEGKAEEVLAILNEVLEEETGKVGLIPVLPAEEKEEIFATVQKKAEDNGLIEDTAREYERYLTVERLRKELGRNYSEKHVDYLIENEVKKDWFDYLSGGKTKSAKEEGAKLKSRMEELSTAFASYVLIDDVDGEQKKKVEKKITEMEKIEDELAKKLKKPKEELKERLESEKEGLNEESKEKVDSWIAYLDRYEKKVEKDLREEIEDGENTIIRTGLTKEQAKLETQKEQLLNQKEREENEEKTDELEEKIKRMEEKIAFVSEWVPEPEEEADGLSEDELAKKLNEAKEQSELKKELREYLEDLRETKDVKYLLAQYLQPSSTKGIIPGKLDDFITTIKENIEKRGRADDFNAISGEEGKLLNYVDKRYLRSLMKSMNSVFGEKGTIIVLTETMDKSRKVIENLDTVIDLLRGEDEFKTAIKKYGEGIVKEEITALIYKKMGSAAKNKKIMSELTSNGIRFDSDGNAEIKDSKKLAPYVLEKAVARLNIEISQEARRQSEDMLDMVDGILSGLAEKNKVYQDAVSAYGEERVTKAVHEYLLGRITLAYAGNDKVEGELRKNGIEFDEETGKPELGKNATKLSKYIIDKVLDQINSEGLESVVPYQREKHVEKTKATEPIVEGAVGVESELKTMTIRTYEDKTQIVEDEEGQLHAKIEGVGLKELKLTEKEAKAALPDDPYEKIYDVVGLYLKDNELVYKIKARNNGGYTGFAYDAYVEVNMKGEIVGETRVLHKK